MMRALLLLVLAFAIGGCDPYHPALQLEASEPPGTPDDGSGDWIIPVGTGVAAAPYITQDEIEGGPSPIAPDGVESADPSIASVTSTGRVAHLEAGQDVDVVVVTGLRVGRTVLRIHARDIDEEIFVRVVQP